MSRRLLSCRQGSAAAEMALVTPLLIIILLSSVELGRYFHNEHLVVKAVRDGARFAARHDFSNFDACSGSPGGNVVADTVNLVRTGLRSGGSAQLPGWGTATVTVSTSCSTGAGGQTMTGIYAGRASGAPIVTVSAVVPYSPLFGNTVFGSLTLAATQQAAVTGI
ncbi:MAG TPA: TadE/TadG family type IV pilus assembly protein [Sphingomicrobium sp.]|nr:TadE/TadG family type IV pilus assembly protein [Sphingomicrobium sp.]